MLFTTGRSEMFKSILNNVFITIFTCLLLFAFNLLIVSFVCWDNYFYINISEWGVEFRANMVATIAVELVVIKVLRLTNVI